MLRVKVFKSANAATQYYSHGDYYGKEGIGIWYGKGAEKLGLKGEFAPKENQVFNDILSGKMPNGQILGRRTKDGLEHTPGVDLTFSCPKSFSIEMLVYADEERKQALESALDKALANTLSYIEEKGYITARKGNGGTEKEKIDKLIFATFKHTTNRNLEPQSHIHCFLANAAQCMDGKYRSIDIRKILGDMRYDKLLGQIFRNELALEVKKLGYDINTKMLAKGGSSFELAHIHPELIKAFSTRTQEIEKLCQEYGINTSSGRDRIVINSRKSKQLVEQEVLAKAWQQVAAATMSKVPDRDKWIQPTLKPYIADSTETLSGTERVLDKLVIKQSDKITTQDIYRELYSKIPNVLPEFGFVNKGSHYVSSTSYKVDGSEGKKGKVYIYANNPGLLKDYTRGNKSIWDYFSDQIMPGSNKQEIFNHLATLAGFKNEHNGKIYNVRSIERNTYNTAPTDISSVKQQPKISPQLWKHVNEYALQKISVPNNQVVKYLQSERGYSNEMIKEMGIGYIPSKKDLKTYLSTKSIDDLNAKEILKALGYMGSSHKMVIPFYNQEGNITGFVGRDIRYTKDSEVGKYVYSKGFARNRSLLNIEIAKHDKPVVIVEGMLDAAHARAQGIDNVLALGGTELSEGQVELQSEIKTKEIVLCMDNDNAGQKAAKKIMAMLSTKLPDITIKNAEFPEAIKDVDQLLSEKGKEAFLDIMVNAKDVYKPQTPEPAKEDIQNSNLHSGSREQVTKSEINQTLSVKDLALLCLDDVTYHKTVFTEAELVKRMLKFSIGKHSFHEIHREINKLKKSGAIIEGGDAMITKELLDKELQILKYAKASLGEANQIIKSKHFESRCGKFEKRELAKNPKFKINEQQKIALRHILTSQDKIIVMEGLPGVGKSTVLNGVRDISNKKIINIIGLGEKFKGAAPTASAAKTLQESSGVESTTLHSLLGKYQGYIEDRGANRSLQALKKQYSNTVVFLDEGSLVSTKMVWKLLKLQEKLGFRLAITLDKKQLGAVEAGKPIEQMLDILPSVKLDKIVRQREAAHRDAVTAASRGDIEKTFSIHDKNISEAKGSKALASQAVDLYMKMNPEQRESTLLISPTRRLRDQINNKIRVALRGEGLLKGNIHKVASLRQKDMTVADHRFAPSFEKNDVLKFNVSYKNGIKSGDYFKVIKTNEITNSLTLEKDGKHLIYILKKGVNHEAKFEVFQEINLRLQEGLKIKFTKNNKALGLINSETAIIQKLDKESITLKLENGSIQNMPQTKLKHIDYGYCTTVHSAQGKTYDNAIAAIANNKWLNNQKSWLVTLSRHRDEFTAIVEDKGQLKHSLINNKGAEVSAIEMVSRGS